MAITWFGGTDTSWAESGGLALGAVTGNVYTDLSKATQLTDLRDKDGNTVTTVVTMVNGHYYFGVNNHPGNVVVDFGAGPYIVYPSDLGDRLATVESLVAALRATPTSGVPTFSDAGNWAPSTVYTAGQYFTAPDGSRCYVNAGYTSGTSFGSADTAATIQTAPAPTGLTQTAAAGLFAPLSLVLGEYIVSVGDTLSDGYDPDPNGYEVLAPFTATSLLPEIDDVAVGGATQVITYRFRPSGSGAGYLPLGLGVIPDSQVSPSAPLVLGTTHTVTTAVSSPVVNDTAITSALQGQPVTGTGIPALSYIGTVIANTSFRLSATPNSQVDVSATANGTVTATIAPAVSFVAHDRIVSYLLDAVDASGTTFPGAGLKIRVGVGTTSYSVPAAPSAPTSFALASTTPTTASFTWVPGSGAGVTEVWKNKNNGTGWRRVARLFSQSSWTDTDVTNAIAAEYKLLARIPGAVSAFTSSLTVSGSAVFSLLPQGGTLPALPDPTFYALTRGTNTTSTAAQVTLSGSDQLFSVLSGGTGATTPLNDPQDRVILKCIKDTTLRRAWGFRGLLTPNNASALLEIYLGSDDFTLTAGSNNFVRVTLQPSGSSVEGKAATYDPTGEGNGTTVGSFQRFTDTAYATNILTGATRTSGGLIPGVTMTPGTYYGIKVIADVPTGGRQLIKVYGGTSAQYGTDGSALPLLYTANLTARFVTARPAGYFILQGLGKQTSPTAAEGWTWKNYHDITPIAA
jgi:hypothetical protein